LFQSSHSIHNYTKDCCFFGEAIGGKRKSDRPHKNWRGCLKENLKVYETYYEKTCQMSRKKRRMDQILGGANNLPIQ